MIINFEYNGKIINGELIRRKRKSLCLRILESGKLQIIAPNNISENKIMDFLYEKGSWITEKQNEMSKRNEKRIIRDFSKNSTIMYLGKEYNVIVKNDTKEKPEVIFDDKNKIFIINTDNVSKENLSLMMEIWYRNKTLEIVKGRIDYYSSNFKDRVSKIVVKEQKRRWASININNVIYFNWRISMAPLEVIDYIVVHEMCHMDYRNHSKDFWRRVGEVMPFYKIYHNYLKENGANMYI